MKKTVQTEWHENFLKMAGSASLIILIVTAWLICIFIFIDQISSLHLMQIFVLSLAIGSISIFLLQIAISFKRTYYNSLKSTTESKFKKLSLISGVFSILMISVLMSLLSFKTLMKDYHHPNSSNISPIEAK